MSIMTEAEPLMSFIIGLGVAIMLFHKPFQTRSMLAMPVGDIEGKVISFGKKCYTYHAEDARCEIPPSK